MPLWILNTVRILFGKNLFNVGVYKGDHYKVNQCFCCAAANKLFLSGSLAWVVFVCLVCRGLPAELETPFGFILLSMDCTQFI